MEVGEITRIRQKESPVPSPVIEGALREVERQDAAMGGGYPATRDGVRLGVACLEDEVREAREAWDSEKKRNGWPDTYSEVEQVVAVGLRMLRAIGPVS